MTALSDVLIREFQNDGGSPTASRRTVQCQEILVVDNPTDAATDLIGLKRPTATQLEGALAYAADTDSDDDPDDLRYSVDVCAIPGTGLEYLHATAVAPTGDAVRTRCEVTDSRRYLHVQSPEADGRVLTSPRVTEGAVTTREVTGGATAPDAVTWTTVLTIPDAYAPADNLSRVIETVVWLSRGADGTGQYVAHLILLTTETPDLTLIAYHLKNIAIDTNLRYQASGNSVIVQIVGGEAGESWKARATVSN